MKEQAEELAAAFQERYGNQVTVSFIDVENEEEMREQTEVKELLARYMPPLIYVNGQPRLYGGISEQMIANIINDILK